jgi:hypothetical protein
MANFLPLGLILNVVKSFKGKFTKFIFQEAYIVSTNYYLKRSLKWQQFTEYFQYEIFLPYEFKIKSPPLCHFRIKALDDKNFSKIKLSLTVFSSYGRNRFQQVIELYELNSFPFFINLSNIPPKSFKEYGGRILCL